MRYYSHKEVATVPKVYDHDWQSIIKDQQESGLNMKQYCSEKGLSYHAFKNNKYALQKKQKQFVPIKQEAQATINLNINGNQISFDSSMDDLMISRILKALTQ